MKPISLQVLPSDYEAFQEAAKAQGRSVAALIREAMVIYRRERIDARTPLLDLPVLPGHRPLRRLPKRDELYDEAFAADPGSPAGRVRARGRTR